ncbi:MAG: hypothetical protein ABFS41_08625 [Myxococcota bacterium]
MSPLLGGEFVVAFLAARIALWIWRSRHQLGAFARDDGPDGPDGGGRPLPRPHPVLRVMPAPAPTASLKRAA